MDERAEQREGEGHRREDEAAADAEGEQDRRDQEQHGQRRPLVPLVLVLGHDPVADHAGQDEEEQGQLEHDEPRAEKRPQGGLHQVAEGEVPLVHQHQADAGRRRVEQAVADRVRQAERRKG